jgi:hypothetical protein
LDIFRKARENVYSALLPLLTGVCSPRMINTLFCIAVGSRLVDYHIWYLWRCCLAVKCTLLYCVTVTWRIQNGVVRSKREEIESGCHRCYYPRSGSGPPYVP